MNEMNELQKFIAALGPGLFLTAAQVPALVKLHRLCQLVVRCGGCRFICAAQDLEHLTQCIKSGQDYIRDVSITCREAGWAYAWHPEPTIPDTYPPSDLTAETRERCWLNLQDLETEPDYGGAFDGFRVTSDADPGL